MNECNDEIGCRSLMIEFITNEFGTLSEMINKKNANWPCHFIGDFAKSEEANKRRAKAIKITRCTSEQHKRRCGFRSAAMNS